jgi:hypothetical protein
MEQTTLPAQSRVHNITTEGMLFTITETIRASNGGDVNPRHQAAVPRRRTDQVCGLGLRVHQPSRG